MSGQLVGQMVECRFIAHGALSCRNHHEEMVGRDGGSQRWQLVPMVHQRVFGTHGGMTITNKLVDECQRVLTTMENDAAFEVQRHACKAFEPAIEARFVLRT